MKIYKIAQNKPLQEAPTNTESEEFDLGWFLQQDASSLDEVKAYLSKYNIDFESLKLKDNDIIVLDFEGKRKVIDDSLSLEDANEWVWKISDYHLSDYVGNEDDEDFTVKFWKNVCTPYSESLYHATREENIESIKKHGLLMKNESRGISNRSMGDAIFTSSNPYETDSYGDIKIQIDLCKMKKDGYMPEVSMEEPIAEGKLREQLAWTIGLREFNATSDYGSEGISESTVAIYGNIPAKYLIWNPEYPS